MVLRKQPPPRLEILSKWNGCPETHYSPPTTAKSVASSTHCARITRVPSQESVYSPDLNTSPAFDLMPLEEAQRSPVGSPKSHELEKLADHNRLGTAGQPVRAETSCRETWLSPASVPGSPNITEHHWQPDSDPKNVTVGEVPLQLQSNNPYLNPRSLQPGQDQSESNDRHSQATSSSDFLGQSEGYIPMTARLSLLDSDHEAFWTEPGHSHNEAQNSTGDARFHNTSSRASQHSMKISGPQEIYLQNTDQQNVASSTIKSSQSPNRLSSDTGIHIPSTISSGISNETSTTSDELVDLKVLDTLGVVSRSPGAAPSVYSTEGTASTDKRQHTDKSSLRLQWPDDLERQNRPVSSIQPSHAEAARQNEQRAETYTIRQINWIGRTGKFLRSPILIQSRNGPCPLLALINALTLQADPQEDAPILRALRTREQISLGLLIEALFEELTTRLSPDEEFPDIEALTRFLTMLHTGMNVNPRLTLETPDSLGTFFRTADLQLYSTFGVPLIHGWLASWSSEAHTAMTRVAQYHEDVQLLPFLKHELEDRIVHGESLSAEEEQKVADIQAIQEFVEVENATQLSFFGLTQLATKLAPGSLSIFFRNDHFSTLYKHPQSHQLYTLVTDAGYANHAEVVWESLVDVSGFNSEFFSGDFRVVSHRSPESSDTAEAPTFNNTTIHGLPTTNEELQTTLPSPQEQSDADYAFALSLQYEEEQRESSGNQQIPNRCSSLARRSPSGNPRMSNAPNRISSIANSLRSQTTLQPHHDPDPDDPNAPPPSYEQAASGPRISPPDRRPQYSESQSNQYPGNRHPRNRYSARPVNTNRFPDRRNSNKDCILM